MFNRVILVGNLTRDIEFRYFQNGGAVGKTAIAVNRRYKAADGTPKEESMFIDVDFFGRTAETANQFLHRGSKVLIEGRLKQDTWTDQNGQNRSKHTINADNFEMLDPNPNSQAFNQNRGGQGGGGYGGGGNSGYGGGGGYGGGQGGGYGGQGGYSRGGQGGGGYGGNAGGQGGGYGANAGGNGGYGGGASQSSKGGAQPNQAQNFAQPQQEKLPEIDVDSDKFDGDDNVPF